MTEQQWAVVDEVDGPFHADMIRGLLEAQGISVLVSKPGAGVAIGITLGLLGRVQILVPSGDLERARQVVSDYYAGAYKDQELIDPEGGSDQLDETAGDG